MKVYQLFSYVTTFERARSVYCVTVIRQGDVLLTPGEITTYHHYSQHSSRKAAIRELEHALRVAALFNDGEFEGVVTKELWLGDEIVSSSVLKHLTAGRSFYVQLVEVK